MKDAFAALEQSVQAALETYANVHRGSGHHSAAATHLYEQAKKIVLDHLKLRGGHTGVWERMTYPLQYTAGSQCRLTWKYAGQFPALASATKIFGLIPATVVHQYVSGNFSK